MAVAFVCLPPFLRLTSVSGDTPDIECTCQEWFLIASQGSLFICLDDEWYWRHRNIIQICIVKLNNGVREAFVLFVRLPSLVLNDNVEMCVIVNKMIDTLWTKQAAYMSKGDINCTHLSFRLVVEKLFSADILQLSYNKLHLLSKTI